MEKESFKEFDSPDKLSTNEQVSFNSLAHMTGEFGLKKVDEFMQK